MAENLAGKELDANHNQAEGDLDADHQTLDQPGKRRLTDGQHSHHGSSNRRAHQPPRTPTAGHTNRRAHQPPRTPTAAHTNRRAHQPPGTPTAGHTNGYLDLVESFESLSTWRQPTPPSASDVRTTLITAVAVDIAHLSPCRIRVAIDGFAAAGKTSFGHELAAAVRTLGRPTLRASLDDFKNPWREARELGYDRTSGEGYYRNAYDFAAARELLLGPAGASGSGHVTLCARDPLTGEDHRSKTITAPGNAVLIVDSVFAFRPEYNPFWEYRIWLEIKPALSLQRGILRDTQAEGLEEATKLHRDRYQVAESLYLAEVDPDAFVDVVIDNSDFAKPFVVRRAQVGR